jgi:hypothetical protein
MADQPTQLRCARLVISAGLLLSAYGCSNVLWSGLMNSNSLLPPSAERSVYLQTRNTSENQSVSLTDLSSRLSGKGYQVVKIRLAGYWLQTQIVVYCHKAAAGSEHRNDGQKRIRNRTRQVVASVSRAPSGVAAVIRPRCSV